MKRKIILSTALILSLTILLLLTSSDSRVEAQNQTRYTAGTGIITLGANQNLSLTINGSGDEAIAVRFRRTRYVKTACADGVCRYVIESQTTSETMISAPNQSSKLDVMGNQIGPDAAVSIEVLSSRRNARVTVQLTDALTGQVQSVLIALLLP